MYFGRRLLVHTWPPNVLRTPSVPCSVLLLVSLVPVFIAHTSPLRRARAFASGIGDVGVYGYRQVASSQSRADAAVTLVLERRRDRVQYSCGAGLFTAVYVVS